MKAGDVITARYRGEVKAGRVLLASSNNISLAVALDGGPSLALLLGNGGYRDLLTQELVEITLCEGHHEAEGQ